MPSQSVPFFYQPPGQSSHIWQGGERCDSKKLPIITWDSKWGSCLSLTSALSGCWKNFWEYFWASWQPSSLEKKFTTYLYKQTSCLTPETLQTITCCLIYCFVKKLVEKKLSASSSLETSWPGQVFRENSCDRKLLDSCDRKLLDSYVVIRNCSDHPTELISLCTDVLSSELDVRGTIFPKLKPVSDLILNGCIRRKGQ